MIVAVSREAGLELTDAARYYVRMMAMFTSIARGERRTLESIATPCSVNA